MALGAVVVLGSSWRHIAAGVALAAAGLTLLTFLREQTMLVAAWALFAGMLLAVGRQWLARVAAVLAVVAIVPLLGGFGVGGYRVASTYAPQLAETRAKLAVGANSAIVKPKKLTPSTPSSFATLTPNANENVGGNLSRLPQGLLDVAIRPYPWESTNGIALLLARVENIVWYLLYALAAVGVIVTLRRRDARLALQFPVLVTCLLIGTGAVTQGNLGTAFRHRDQVLWALALCSAAGLQWLATESRWAPRRERADKPTTPAIDAPPRSQEPLGVG
jgi:hypothetical protein